MPESPDELRVAVTGLVGFAAAEEAMLLTEIARAEDRSTAESWGALPTIAHTSEFRDEQVRRLVAIRQGSQPPEFPRVDHGSADTYRRYSEPDAESVWNLSRTTNATLIDETRLCSDADLVDPGRNPWLRRRQLWLQIIVRGFWHPTGHLGEYYLQHGRPERALSLHRHALATADYLGAPSMALGMAHYSLACAQATAGHADEAIRSLAEAFARNPDLREHARTEPELATLSGHGA
jgi:hypothetical protein